MHTPCDDPAVSCQRADVDTEEKIQPSCHGPFDWEIVEVIARYLVDALSITLSRDSVVPIHHLTVQIGAENHACGARKISETDLQLVEAIYVFIDPEDRRLNAVPDCVW